jgi:hypothetical protein
VANLQAARSRSLASRWDSYLIFSAMIPLTDLRKYIVCMYENRIKAIKIKEKCVCVCVCVCPGITKSNRWNKVSIIKVHCMHVWEYHNEIALYN